MKNHAGNEYCIRGNRVGLFFLFLILIYLDNGHTVELTIDNRLLYIPPDCYTRVSIGSRIVDSLVISTIQASVVADCEAACSANGTSCGSFSFGVGSRGNGSCTLSSRVPNGPSDLQRDSDYDVYAKGKISLRGCYTGSRMSLNTSGMLTTSPLNQKQNDTPEKSVGSLSINTNGQRLFGNNSLLNIGNILFNRNQNTNGNVQTLGRPTSPYSFTSDDQYRITDILNNRKQYGPMRDEIENSWNIEKLAFNRGVNDKWRGSQWFNDFNYFPIITGNHLRPHHENHEIHNDHPAFLIIEEPYAPDGDVFGKRLNNHKITKDFYTPALVSRKLRPSDDDDYVAGFNDFGFGQRLNSGRNTESSSTNNWRNSGMSIKRPSNVHNYGLESVIYEPTNERKACFRRLLSGKRIVDPYVKRIEECDRLQDCHRMCEHERGFMCEGFNYRSRPATRPICELTSMPPSRVDLNRDFVTDPRYDFYERDLTRRKCEPRRDKFRPSAPDYNPGTSQNWYPGDSSGNRPHWQPSGGHRGQYIPPKPTVPPQSPVTPRPPPYGGTFGGDTTLTVHGGPRPIDHDQRHPDEWTRPKPNDVPRPRPPVPLPVRPIESYYPSPDDATSSHSRPVERPRPDDYYYNHNPLPAMGYTPHPPVHYNPPHYLPSRPSGDGYSGNGYSYGRPGDGALIGHGGNYGHKYPMRRVGYHPDPATNEISSHYIPTRMKPSKPDSVESYGSSYADGYHTHYLGPSKSPSRPLDPEPHHPKVSSEKDSNYGDFYHYGGAYGYSDRPRLPPKTIPSSGSSRECSIRSAGGFRLARGIIRRSYLTANLGQCESLCQNQKEFMCLTFAYRYNLAATSPTDNCLLSDAPFENLVFYTDLEPDRDYDIYAMMVNAKWCESRGRPPSNPRRSRPPDECFWRVRSGLGMPPSVVKKPMRVDGMGECEAECVSARDFTCRSFVFRYESHSMDGHTNCYISDWPALEIHPHKMQDMEGAELYERGSFGRGCEPHHPIPLPDPPSPSRPALDYKPSRTDEASCYAGYDRPCKLTPYAIIFTTKVDSEAECRKKCSIMRQNIGRDSPPCMSYSYKFAGDRHSDNCQLSDVPTRDLRPGLDYTHDMNYELYVFKELEPKCSIFDDSYSHPPSSFSPSSDIPSPQFSDKPYTKPEDPYYYEIHVPEPNKPGVAVPGHSHTYSEENPHFIQDERFFYPPELTIFNHYTVNGYPCKRGTKCERSSIGGFWSCETEGAESGAWDYCCAPNHACGYSKGYSYPWCYVGAPPDQWRPCSETYYPYSIRPRPIRPRADRPPFVKCDYDVECQGRHWPLAVLHGEAPPNGTDSVALANNHNDNKLNNSDAVTPAVSPIEEVKNNTNSTNENLRRTNDEVILVPLRVINNGSFNRSDSSRINSRYKIPRNTNSSLVNLPRVSRDDSPQYFITKRLNAGFSARSNDRLTGKGTIAKIERISKPSDLREVESGQRLVMVASSRGPQPTVTHNVEIDVPPVSVVVHNATTVIPNSTRQWVKIAALDRSVE